MESVTDNSIADAIEFPRPRLAVSPAGKTSLCLSIPHVPCAGTALIPHSPRCASTCAGWGNRTPDHSLENCYFAIKLIPRALRSFSEVVPSAPRTTEAYQIPGIFSLLSQSYMLNA